MLYEVITSQSLLVDVVDSLHAAAEDKRIKAVVLRLDGMMGGGLAKLQAVAEALQAVCVTDIAAVTASISRNNFV